MNDATNNDPIGQRDGSPTSVSDIRLNSSDRAHISALCTQYEQQVSGGAPELERLVREAEPRLQLALLERLLPIEIEYLAETRGGVPTLHELAVLYPNLEDLLTIAYGRLSADVRLPDVLGVYRLVRVLDGGSQATIAIGRHKRLQQQVAIKFSRDEESSRRLLQEAEFLSRLKGLNVPAVIDDGRAPDGAAYFIMEYLEGRNLLDLVSDRGPIRDPLACAKIVLQIADTLARIHERGIIHRDLTPKNIHLGDDGVVRIVDFGLAIDVNSGTAVRRPLKEFHGTEAFMSPEQLAGDGKVDGKLSDIFSLGRILLFTALGVDSVLATLPKDGSVPDTQRLPSQPPAIPDRTLARIHAKASRTEPSQRYSSANEMAGDLRAYIDGIENRRQWVQRLTRAAAIIAVGTGTVWAANSLWWSEDVPAAAGIDRVEESVPSPSVELASAPIPIHTISLGDGLDMEFVDIPAGSFRMGASPDDDLADADEQPPHEVTISKSFAMSTTEVTVEQFAAFVKATDYVTDAERELANLTPLARVGASLLNNAVTTWKEPGFNQEPTHPVVNVSWNDAVQFCEWLRQQQHRYYRLPTEAEWEYACRAGAGTRFSFGDDVLLLPQHARVAPMQAGVDGGFTRPVREHPANAFGLMGMHGNVAEWCGDWYSAQFYAASPSENPTGPDQGKYRVHRGGAFNLPPEDCRASDRNGGVPSGMEPHIGFRVVDAGLIDIAGRWTIVEGAGFLWTSPVTLNEDGTSSLGFGQWNYVWNGFDRFEITAQGGVKPSAFGGRDADFVWDAKLSGDRLELFQQGKRKLTLERVQ